jgi:hypothetical protein
MPNVTAMASAPPTVILMRVDAGGTFERALRLQLVQTFRVSHAANRGRDHGGETEQAIGSQR